MGFSAWSLLSLTSTARGVLTRPDELGVRYVYDTTVPNGRYVAVGDLVVIRDNRYVLAPGGSTTSRNRTPARSGTDAQTAGAPTSSTAARSGSPTGAPTAVPSSTTTTAREKNSRYGYSRRTTRARSDLLTGHFPSRRSSPPTSRDHSRTPSGASARPSYVPCWKGAW